MRVLATILFVLAVGPVADTRVAVADSRGDALAEWLDRRGAKFGANLPRNVMT